MLRYRCTLVTRVAIGSPHSPRILIASGSVSYDVDKNKYKKHYASYAVGYIYIVL